METKLTDENFEKELEGSEKPALVDFFATWCDPCSLLAPVLEKVAGEFSGKLILVKVNLDDIPLTAQRLGIQQIPTVLLFKKGKAEGGFIGLRREEDIRKWLESMNL